MWTRIAEHNVLGRFHTHVSNDQLVPFANEYGSHIFVSMRRREYANEVLSHRHLGLRVVKEFITMKY